VIARAITAVRIAWLQIRRDIALQEIRKARRARIKNTQSMLEWALQVEQYELDIDRLQARRQMARELVSSQPTTMAFGNEAADPRLAFADSGSAMSSPAPRVPRRSLIDATDGIFKTVLVALALLFLLLIALHLSPQVADQLWGAR